MENTQTETEMNFQNIFEAIPGLFLIIKPNTPYYSILGASNRYIEETSTTREKIIGRRYYSRSL